MTKARDIASAAPAPSTVSATEIGYLDGVSSAIQTQIDGKSSTSHNHNSDYIAKTLTTTTGDLIYASSANTPARLGIGSTGQVLTVSGGIPTWAAGGGGSIARVWANKTTTTIGSGNQAIAWDDTDSYDTDGFHDPSSNNSRITIPSGKAGVYLFEFSVTFDGGSGLLYFTFYKNGAGHFGVEDTSYSGINYTYRLSHTTPMNAGDYMQIYINPANGRALRGGKFAAYRLGDL